MIPIPFDKFSRQGQADAGSVGFGSKKGVEDTFSAINRNAFSRIFDGNMNVGGGSVILKSICPDCYATPIGCRFQCIGNQPHENLFHMIGIQLHLGKAPV